MDLTILVINGGSSTIKCSLFEGKNKEPLWSVHREWKGKYHEELEKILNSMPHNTLTAIGHRVVHGGETFHETTLVTEEVKQKIREQFFLAPLHNPINLEGIETTEKLFPKTPQFAAFDTAFHSTLNNAAATYPLPYSYRQQAIRRYGFHGISFSYCAKQTGEFLNRDLKELKLVICHLGAGASLCAVAGGKSVDTTMGMTPLEGLMMGTRSGSVDPGILLYLLKENKLSLDGLDNLLNKQSGLLGISGISEDMREIMEAAKNGHACAQLAIEMFVHRLTRLIGSMIASLGGLDVLVFTAGIGENAPLIREKACAAFTFLGLEIDPEKNQSPSQKEREISSLNSDIKVLVIPTHEEWEIASQCRLIETRVN